MRMFRAEVYYDPSGYKDGKNDCYKVRCDNPGGMTAIGDVLFKHLSRG